MDPKSSAFKWSEEHIHKLILEVKENDILYNTKHSEYRSRSAVEEVWSKIDIKLGKPPGVSKEQWQKMRMCFRRIFNSDTDQQWSWKFYKHLSFLEPHLRFINPDNSLQKCIKRAQEKYSEESTVDLITDDNKVEDELRPSENIKIDLVTNKDNIDVYYISNEQEQEVDKYREEFLVEYINDTTEEQYESECKNNEPVSKKKILIKRDFPETSQDRVSSSSVKKAKLSESPTNSVQKITSEETMLHLKKEKHQLIHTSSQTSTPKETTPPPCLCQTDQETLFLRSLLEDFKSMSRKNKAIFKIKVQQVMLGLLYPDDD